MFLREGVCLNVLDIVSSGCLGGGKPYPHRLPLNAVLDMEKKHKTREEARHKNGIKSDSPTRQKKHYLKRKESGLNATS